ncbi:RNA polymerase sigma-70 factor [Parapedobacter sp. SGR-10]|uniref:RNA polymerase sigma factor n=1 Tax=Parapedobacter sp. SGR-10 TaxID=2710879 RepID=UPI0013D8AA26|nr:RNA polymerase sigma-70 factor [Parapedobacter sp. SGR-10]NGF56593.1 RNA polymerase sigma-70 factor [Parapedobacter sp. SGR-10]
MDKTIDNEQDLLAEVSRGDEDAFLQLYDTHWEYLFVYVSGLLKDKDDAEDVLQELFITIWQSRDRLLHIHDLKSYMWKAARNMALRKLMLDKRQNQSIDSFMDFVATHHLSPAQEYDVKELSSYIHQQIDSLPTKMKEVFVLSREIGLSNKEIARQLDLSEHTVKKQINNSIKRIKENMGYLHPFLLFIIF